MSTPTQYRFDREFAFPNYFENERKVGRVKNCDIELHEYRMTWLNFHVTSVIVICFVEKLSLKWNARVN